MEIPIGELIAHAKHERKPLWIVYTDRSGDTEIQPCMVNSRCGKASIWGFSIYRRAGGYRTLGLYLDGWAAERPDARVFSTEAEALQCAGPDYHVVSNGDMPTAKWLEKAHREGKLQRHEQ